MSHCGLARYNDWSVSTFCMSGGLTKTWFFWNKLSLPFLPFLVVKGELLFIFWSKKIRLWWPFVIFQFGKVTFLVIFGWSFGSIRWYLVYSLKIKGELWLTFWFNQMPFGLYFGEKRWTLIDLFVQSDDIWSIFWWKRVNFDWSFGSIRWYLVYSLVIKAELWLTFWFNQMPFGL